MGFLEASIQKLAQPAPSSADLMWQQPAEPAEEMGEVEAVRSEEAIAAPAVAISACIIANTPYNPAFWNTPAVQPKNNCYNYAMNWRSDTFAQPGRISGHLYTAINCGAVGTAADWDGCHPYCSGSHQTAHLDEFAQIVDREHRVARRESDKLTPLAVEKSASSDQNAAHACLHSILCTWTSLNGK